MCQKLGWEAPKYSKLSEKDDKFLYSVSVLRTATGRGKSRKAGGLITIQLPNLDETFGFVEVQTLIQMIISKFHQCLICKLHLKDDYLAIPLLAHTLMELFIYHAF